MKLTNAQSQAIDRLYECDATILVASTGAGKTVIALTAINDLIEEGVLHKVIVAAPAKVLETVVWPNEAAKWDHLRGLRIVQLEGDSKERTKRLLNSDGETQVIMVSLNNLDWLLQQDHNADGIVVDELSKGAGKQTAKLKSKKWAGRIIWRCGMTATPVSQNFEKLYSMARIIDFGRSLGTNKQRYLDTYFTPDYQGYHWTLREGADAQIMGKVASLVHLMDDTKADELPPISESVIYFDMPEDTREVYNDMRRHMVADDIEAANQAVKSGKLRQLASGFLYQESSEEWTAYDIARFHAVDDWLVGLDGAPGLIFYEFVAQGIWLQGAIDNVYQYRNIKIAQINSMSHGVEGLQHIYSDLLFIQPIWSRDATEQAIGRVWRQGQTRPVTVTTLVCRDTLDDLVVARVEDRGRWMELFKQHLKG